MWRRVGRDSAVFVASALIMALMQAAFRWLAIDQLSVDNYGRVALLLGIFNTALLVAHFGVPTATVRLAARSSGRADRELIVAAAKVTLIPCVVTSAFMGVVTLAVAHSLFVAVIAAAGTPPMVGAVILAGFMRGKGSVWRAASIQPLNALAQLVFLAAVAASGVDVDAGSVLASFYVGNLAALAIALVLLVPHVRRLGGGKGFVEEAARPASLARFSAWIMIGDVALYGFTIVPRIALVHLSYRQVAYFDLALLVYQIPERITVSLVIALIPAAARLHLERRRVLMPSLLDAAALAAALGALDAILWWTHLVRRVLEHAGLAEYAAAEPLLLVVILAAPAELLFAINRGVLQALGDSRTQARLAWLVLLSSLPFVPAAVFLGPTWVAALLVAQLWALYLLSRRTIPRDETREVPVVGRVFALVRSRHATA